MNVFNNVSSQVSGIGSSLGSWFKKEGKEAESEGQNTTEAVTEEQKSPQVQDEASPANISNKSVKGSADENEDATSQHSGATEGADSNPPSPAEEEGKAGFASVADLELKANQFMEGIGFNLSGVSSRASAGAKTVGSFFSTAFSKAGASVKEASTRIKETVEKNALISEFNKEQEAFIKAKGGKPGQAIPPWVGYPQEDSLKEEIMALSTDRRNFVRSPPTGVNFEFDLEQFLPVAEATLAVDSNLEKMRFDLVPKVVNEESFWRNYFYRVGLIRQSTELSSLEKENPAGDTDDKKNIQGNKGAKSKEEEGDQPPESLAQGGGESEFVSDCFQPSSKDVEEVKKGISKLTKPSGEEDWEAELREELGEELNEFEVVDGASKDSEHWEQELQSMIDDEDSTSDLR